MQPSVASQLFAWLYNVVDLCILTQCISWLKKHIENLNQRNSAIYGIYF